MLFWGAQDLSLYILREEAFNLFQALIFQTGTPLYYGIYVLEEHSDNSEITSPSPNQLKPINYFVSIDFEIELSYGLMEEFGAVVISL